MMNRLVGVCFLMMLPACDADKSDTGAIEPVSDDTGTSSDADADADADGGPVGEELTWHEDVQPMVEKHCTRCHYAGGLGIGNFQDAEVVDAMAEIMLSRIDSGEMPPPVSDPECRDYVGSGHLTMPQESRDVFSAWIDGGKLRGDPADTPEIEPIIETLADPDMIVQLPMPYTPTFEDTENPGNEYRCFVLDPELEETTFLTAMAPQVDQKALVHHIVLFTKNVDDITEEELSPDGYSCIDDGMADGINGMVAGWAPGALPVEFPEGHGMRLTPDDRLILQMHYFQSGPEVVGVADQTGYAFRTAPEVDRRVMMYPIGLYDFTIPAGDENYTDGFEFTLPPGIGFDILAAFPHMHVLGKGYRLWADTAEDGRECVLESDQYDFDNQQTYMFKEPLSVQAGDTLGFECTWDNSADNPDQFFDEPQDIRYGERTNEEMCFTFTLIGL